MVISLTLPELERELENLGEPRYRARQILDWIFRQRVADYDAMANVPARLRGVLAERFGGWGMEVVRETGAKDTTRKFLFRLGDGQLVESVLIPASSALYGARADRRTLCVSSQVGCAYGCRFCASGLDGWKRHLDVGEIVGQFLSVERASGEKINNIVFMGMGEPFANYANVLKALEILNAPWGVGLGARHMTVSTSGLVPRIRDFADQPLQVRLAISLHGATDAVRETIMPINKRYPLADLLDACAYFTTRKKQYLTFEFILIHGINDSPDHARHLAAAAGRLRAKVNVIPYNTVTGLAWERPDEATQDAFMAVLKHHHVPATLRREKGHDIAAACGQLRLQTEREKSFAPREAAH